MAVDNRLRQAKNLSLTSSLSSGGDSVGSNDRDDLRLIRLSKRSSIDITLSNLKRGGRVDLELYTGKNSSAVRKIGNVDFSRLTNRQRNQALSLVDSARNGQAIGRTFEAGDYYLRVRYRSGKGRVNYTLAAAANDENAGDALTTARSITADNTPYSDYVGAADRNDFYQFTVAQASNATVSLDTLSGDANLLLLDGNGTQIGIANSSTIAESITQRLNQGNYFLQVIPAAGLAPSRYQVRVSAQVISGGGGGGTIPPPPPIEPPDNGGNTFETATPITVDFSPRFLNDFVTDADPTDHYSFTLSDDSIFNLSLTGLTADANVELFAADGSQVGASFNGGAAEESIAITPIDPFASVPFPLLAKGTYYIRVSQGATGQSTPYRMDFSAVPGIDRAGNDPASSLDITANLVSTSISQPLNFTPEFVGGLDTNDFYKFVIPDGGSFLSTKLTIQGSSTNSDLDVRLLKENGTANPDLITSSISAGNANESFGGNLAGGTYYLQVLPSASTPTPQGGFYTLSLYTRPANGEPLIARDINPGEGNSSPQQLTVVGNNKVFFVASDSESTSLWLADGTVDQVNFGTLQSIKKTELGVNLSDIGNLVSGRFGGNDVLYFTADSGTGPSLWRTDGTAAGTQAVLNINSVPGASGLAGKPVSVNDVLYFVLQKPGGGSTQTEPFALWRSDGTVTGTTAISAGFFEGTIGNLTAIGSTLYFSATQKPASQADLGTGEELWQITSPVAAPQRIDVNPGSGSSSPNNFFAFNNSLYFTANGSTPSEPITGNELWKLSSGSTTPTLIQDLLPGTGNSAFQGSPNFTVFKDELYFTARGTNGTDSTGNSIRTGQELWKLTSGDTIALVADLNTSGIGESSSDPVNLTVVGSGAEAVLYFAANNFVNGQELWSYTGTGSPTLINLRSEVIGDPNAPGNGSNPEELINVGGTLYFRALGDFPDAQSIPTDYGQELWKIASTPNALPTAFDILPGVESSVPSSLTEVLGRLFFVANNGLTDSSGASTIQGNGSELWVIG